MDSKHKAGRWKWMASIPLTWAVATAAAPISVERETGFFGKGAGASGWIVADLDGDGVQEVVGEESTYPDPERHLFAAHWRPVAQRLEKIDILSLPILTESPARSRGLRQFVAADGSTQIVLVDELGYVEIIGGLPLQRRRSYRAPGGDKLAFEIADIDGDGRIEIIALTTNTAGRIDVIDLLTGALVRQFGVSVGSMAGLAVGPLDADTAMEIVVASSTGIMVVDGVSGVIDGALPGFYYGTPLVHDVDADGQPELIANGSGTRVALVRTNPLSEWMSQTLPNGINLGVLELEGDNAPLLIRGNWENDRLDFIPLPGLGAPTRSLVLPNEVDTPVTVADLDQDGGLEVVAVSGLSSSVGDRPAVLDFDSGATLWTDSEETGPYAAIDVGNLDRDPTPEIAVASRTSEEGSGSGRLHVLDSTTMQEERRRAGLTDFSSGVVEDVCIAQLDNDNSLEIVWSGSAANHGALEIVDAFTFARQVAIGSFDDRYAQTRLMAIGPANPNGGRFSSLAVATQQGPSLDTPIAMVELDALTGFQTGSISSSPTQATPSRIEAIDLDDDGSVEYVFGDYLSVSFRRSLLGERYASIPSARPRAFTAATAPNGVRALVTIGIDGGLSLLDASDLSVIGSLLLGRPTPPTAIRTSDLDPSTILGCAGDTVFKADLRTGSVTWGPRIGISLCVSGRIPSLGAQDGRDRIVIGSARGVHVVTIAECMFCDGFE